MAGTRQVVTDLHDFLKPLLTGRRVVARPVPVDLVQGEQLVHLWLSQVEHSSASPIEAREHSVAVWVVRPGDFAADVDAALEELLDEVLDALDTHDTATWATAVRAVYPPGPTAQHPAYLVTVTQEV